MNIYRAFLAVKKQLVLLVFTSLTLNSTCHAEIEVILKEPQWKFILDNQALGETEARLASNESSFSKKIQPLLAAQDHGAVILAFKNRNIENDSAALRLLRGQIFLQLHRYDEAENALSSALQIMPNLALSHRSLSMVYILQKKYKKSQKHLRSTIELGVADAQVYGQLAYVNLQLEQAASAVAGYQYALFLDPNNGQWRQGLLYALISSHAFDQAQALLEEMLLSDSSNVDLWLQRGQLALKQDRPVQALSSMEVAIQLGEKNIANLSTAAQLHIQSGSPKRAVTLMANNIRAFTRNNSSIDVVDQISAWLVFQKDWPTLEKLLNALSSKSINLSPRFNSQFSTYRAQLFLAKGNNKKARKQLEQAIKSDPSNGDALLNLATLLRDQSVNERALLYYVRAEAMPLFKERALLGRAQLEIDRQNYKEALRLLRFVVQGNPARSDVLANIQSLENLVRNQG